MIEKDEIMVHEFWLRINRAMDRYCQLYPQEDAGACLEAYQTWLLDSWGIQHTTKSITVKDPKKYTLFLLQFSH